MIDCINCSAILYDVLADVRKTCLQPFTCTLTSSSGLIRALCSHPFPESPFADGILVIVQPTNVSEVHKLYLNQSMDLRTPVTVPVERDGEYQVSIFAIREGMGILKSTGLCNIIFVSATVVTSAAPAVCGTTATGTLHISY